MASGSRSSLGISWEVLSPIYIVNDFINHCIYCFSIGTLEYDINGLEYIQFTLGILEIFGSSKQWPNQISTEEFVSTLQSLATILRVWKPIRLPLDDYVMQMFSSLNFRNCFEIICRSIEATIFRIWILLDPRGYSNPHAPIFYYLDSTLGYVKKSEDTVNKKFAKCLPFTEERRNQFRAEMLTVHTGERILPRNILESLTYFLLRGIDSFVIMAAVNTQIGHLLKDFTLTNLIQTSTDTVCQICHDNLDQKQDLASFVVCNHVCCNLCLETWLKTTVQDGKRWSCPTCRSSFTEYGVIEVQGTKTVKVLYDNKCLWFVIV